ncbi:30S ribosomal protein S8 [Candidatus Pinguicoccus supinus]|uniref:Small ribosomal subunit protein uS8 n=1 Tax=Candidatus Pinguicoccus supinus TaxID=2529394 RepID=A0A7T0BRM7_9BACT|nr:30S ribosomal protein S8 [Candidatus Pinguicoccus supinus]
MVLKLLLKTFFIRKYKVFFFKGLLKKINVYLESNLTNDIKYLNSIDCISLPGRKVFIKCLNLKFKSFPGLNIISSSKGIITSVEALKLNVGGENILNIW